MGAEIHMFGGQGWSGLFQDRSLAVAKGDVCASPYTRQLLDKCHKCLIKDASSLYAEGIDDVAQLFSNFATPDSLLDPPEQCRSQPVVQGTTLCLFQLLRYLSRISDASVYQEAFGRLYGTAGFCSGILPSVVVASSPTIEAFVDNGVQAFRAAFWLGFRAGEYSRRILGVLDTDHSPWTYSLNGLNQARVTQLVSAFNSEVKNESHISIAGILRDSNITVAGSSSALKLFVSQLPTSCVARPVHVNALYHGGERMAPVVGTILNDFQKHNVTLPSFNDLRKVVFSSFDGSKLSTIASHKSLARHVLEMILVKHCDWTSVLRSIDIDQEKRVAVIYGPSPNLLVPPSFVSSKKTLDRLDVSHENAEVQLLSNYRQSEDDIAIVGVGLDLPNGSDLDGFWESLKNGINCVSRVPDDRFSHQDHVGKSAQATPHHGNFISNPWAFDNALFNISPREAKSMDPQQRVLLQCSFHALQHAGYVADATECFQRSTFGCFVGAATGDYVDRMSRDMDVYYSPGTLRAFLSGRISYCFSHSGPSVVVDTACSGSLVAIHQACKALLAKECNAALAGGVNVICGPDMQRGLGRARFLSPTGQCRPFDAAADGYCRAEGCAMFVLKRLPDAIAENDRILGVIKGTGINQSGGADSITHPHAKTQQALFEAVLNRSNILPQSITAAELHGTGTQAGDPVEYESVASVFGSRRSSSNPLIVTSIKGNIGHAEAASGSAGLAKLLMMMAKGQVPPQVGFEALNPKIAAIKDDNTLIPKQLLDWPRQQGMPRRALLNNFGAAGSNACLILEEYVDMENERGEVAPCDDNGSYVFVLSAKDATTLERYRQSVIRNTNLRQMRLCDLAYTSTARRTMFESRLVVKSASTEELLQSLESARVSPEALARVSSHHQIVFVFSGQGSQYLGMGRDLFETAPQFKKDILHCEHILVQANYPSILPIIQSRGLSMESLADHGIVATHCAVFAVEYALARLWISWGIRPDALLGHSLGEYAAFVIAGVLSVEDAILIIARRAKLVEGLCELGTSGMLSVNDSASKVQSFILTASPPLEGLTIACDNSPQQCVVSGPIDQLDDLAIAIGAAGTKTKKLDVPFGFHSPAMETIRSPLDDFVAKVQLHKPSIPLGLGLNGRMHYPTDFDHGYFASQAINPVRFRETVEDFLSHTRQNDTICLEIGPHPIVLPMMRTIKPVSSTVYLGSLRREKKGWWSMNESIAELVRCGFELDFRKIYEGQGVRLVDIPLYPFAQEEFRVPYVAIDAPEVLNSHLSSRTPSARYGSLLSPQQASSRTQDRVVYGANQRIEKFIHGHIVAGLPLCPASVYIELALQAARELQQPDATCGRIVVKDVIFSSPLVHQINQSQPETAVQVALGRTGKSGDGAPFRVSSGADDTKQTNCEGFLGLSSKDTTDTLVDTTSERFRGAQQSGQLIKRKMLYETIFSRVVSYSELYQTIDYLELNDSGKVAWGSFRLRHIALLGECVSQPVFVDTLLHAAGFLANCSTSASEVCICTKIESINLWIDAVDYTESFRLYTEISSSQKAVVGNSFAYDADGKLVGSIQGITFRRLGKEAFTRSLQTGVRDISSTKSSGGSRNGLSNHNIDHVEYDTIASPGTNGIRSIPANQSNIGIGHVNGVDKAKLAKPESDTHISNEINNAVAEVAGLPIHKVHGETDLQQIGLDSLMAFELLDLLGSQFGLEIPHTEFDSCRTPNDIVRLVESIKQPPVQRNGVRQASKSLSLIRRGSDRLSPLYMVHDGSGLCSMYSAIGSLGRNVFGISCDEKNQFRTVNDMATAYAGLVDTSKSFILGGWSFGGIVAYEMARILHERHAPVWGVIMIDSPCPTTHDGIPESVLRRICHGKPDWLLRNFETHTAMLGEHSPPATATPFPIVLLRSAEAVGVDIIGDVPCPFLGNGVERREQVSLWRGLVGPDLQVLEIPGNHFQAFDEKIVEETSRSISQAIGLIEQGPV